MDVDRLNELEMIDPRPLPPWRIEAFAEIKIETDQEVAKERAETVQLTPDIVVYSDASGRDGHLGAAAVALGNDQEIIESRQVQVGPMKHWLIHVTELIGIFYTISTVFKMFHQHSSNTGSRSTTVIILYNSKSALQAIQNVKNVSGQ
jgi:hypothetical protein